MKNGASRVVEVLMEQLSRALGGREVRCCASSLRPATRAHFGAARILPPLPELLASPRLGAARPVWALLLLQWLALASEGLNPDLVKAYSKEEHSPI